MLSEKGSCYIMNWDYKNENSVFLYIDTWTAYLGMEKIHPDNLAVVASGPSTWAVPLNHIALANVSWTRSGVRFFCDKHVIRQSWPPIRAGRRWPLCYTTFVLIPTTEHHLVLPHSHCVDAFPGV